VDLKHPSPRGRVGQVHEEDLVESSLPEELGREARDVVGGGNYEHVAAPILEPRKETTEDALRDPGILLCGP
jgi:hypothetical protein